MGRSHVDGIQVLLAQDDPRLEIVDEVLDLRLGEIGVDRRGDAAGPDRTQPGMDQPWRVRSCDQDPVSDLKTASPKGVRGATDGVRQVRKGLGPIDGDDRRSVVEPFDR